MRTENGEIHLRRSSGLRAEFSTLDTFIFNTLGYALGLVLASAPLFLGAQYPNANVYVVVTLGAALAVFNGLTYGLFAAAMPNTGGDYVYITRTLSPALGFTANWGFTWSQLFGLGVYTAACVTDALIPGLASLGYATDNPALVRVANALNRPLLTWAVGMTLLLTVFLISARGTRALKRFLNLFFCIAMLGTLCMLAVLWRSSPHDFVTAYDGFMERYASYPNAYHSIISRGEQMGLRIGQPTNLWSAVLALPIGYWMFIGFTYSVYVGGEVKEPQKSQPRAIIGALVIGYILYMAAMGRYYDVVGRDFNNAIALVKDSPGTSLLGGASMTLMVGLLTRSLLANCLISLSTFLWFYLLLFVMVAFCTRNLFAWSFDHVIPDIRRVSPRTGAPLTATSLVVGLAAAVLTCHAFLKIAFINYIALFSICFLITGIAAMVFPYRRPSLFRNSPTLVRRTVGGVPLIVIAGFGDVVLFIIVLYSALTNPGVSGVQGFLPGVILVIVYGGGYLVFAAARAWRRRTTGQDLNAIYDEIGTD